MQGAGRRTGLVPCGPEAGNRRRPVRRLRAGLVPLLPGGSGIPPGRHYDRSARSSLDWDWRHCLVPGSAAWS